MKMVLTFLLIGNPPYGITLTDSEKKLYKTIYNSTKTTKGIQKGSMDSFSLFIELSFNLLKKNGNFAMIIPISITSSESLTGIHRILKQQCDDIRISSYAVRPQPIFTNATVNTSILLFTRTEKPFNSIKATKMYRKGQNFNLQHLIDNLEYIEVKDYLLYGRIPKISHSMECLILAKIRKHPLLGTKIRKTGSPIYYRFAGGRYFKVVTNYSTGSSAERVIYLDNDIADAIGALLSSNLSFWFYQIYSDNLNWKNYELENFPIPELSPSQLQQLKKLYSIYLEDIERNANHRQTSGKSSYKVSSFTEYKIGRSKAIINKIDDFIAPLYGLSQKEIDFVKNYEIEFRLSDEE